MVRITFENEKLLLVVSLKFDMLRYSLSVISSAWIWNRTKVDATSGLPKTNPFNPKKITVVHFP